MSGGLSNRFSQPVTAGTASTACKPAHSAPIPAPSFPPSELITGVAKRECQEETNQEEMSRSVKQKFAWTAECTLGWSVQTVSWEEGWFCTSQAANLYTAQGCMATVFGRIGRADSKSLFLGARSRGESDVVAMSLGGGTTFEAESISHISIASDQAAPPRPRPNVKPSKLVLGAWPGHAATAAAGAILLEPMQNFLRSLHCHPVPWRPRTGARLRPILAKEYL